IVVLDGRVGIEIAEWKKVPIVVADSLACDELFFSVRKAFETGAAVVADPSSVDDFAIKSVLLGHHIAHAGPHAVDVCTKEIKIVCPPKVFGAAADEILVVDVMAGVVLRKEGLESDA